MDPSPSAARWTSTLFAVVFGSALLLVARGYQFGGSNHTVYLLSALHACDPRLLANDWFTTHTLQYHAVFGWITEWLMRRNILEPSYLAGHFACVFAMHLAWFRLVIRLGGSLRIYLASVILFYVSALGFGLGFYEFLQDSEMLPSNVANVAMLWGLVCWIEGKPVIAGIWLGVAGAFHLNHAILGIGAYAALVVWQRCFPFALTLTLSQSTGRGDRSRAKLAGFAIVVGLSLFGIAPAARTILHGEGRLPLKEFVDLYVRLRHPHHYDPRAWPIALWACFLWPIPLALLARSIGPAAAQWRETRRVFLLFLAMIAFALLFAGLWFTSESLIQMSLYRFSIYPKLIACILAAFTLQQWKPWALPLVERIVPIIVTGVVAIVLVFRIKPISPYLQEHLGAAVLFVALLNVAWASRPWANLGMSLALIALIFIAWNRWLGLATAPADDADYLATCRWVRDHTPLDAVFLVPPQEQSMRLIGQRAIVINFKGVPQLSGELPEWRDRLEAVLGMTDLTALPHPFDKTLATIGQIYDSRRAGDLVAVARKYGARFVLATHPWPDLADRVVYSNATGSYVLYDLDR